MYFDADLDLDPHYNVCGSKTPWAKGSDLQECCRDGTENVGLNCGQVSAAAGQNQHCANQRGESKFESVNITLLYTSCVVPHVRICRNTTTLKRFTLIYC